jgi:hypothetical protein
MLRQAPLMPQTTLILVFISTTKFPPVVPLDPPVVQPSKWPEQGSRYLLKRPQTT